MPQAGERQVPRRLTSLVANALLLQLRFLFWSAASSNDLTPLSTNVLSLLNITPYPNSAHGLINVGHLYYLYMSLLTLFTTNSINILAGINGVEVAQSCVIAASILLHNALSLPSSTHAFSTVLLGPFLLSSLALLRTNWYPATTFVGDTYCYFAGSVFAVVAVHGHFSKTLLCFFIPQIFNFLISCPQLFGLLDCPRHRLPKYLPSKGVMTTSRRADGGMNLTGINCVLAALGDMREETLTFAVVMVQVACCGVGFAVRYGGGRAVFFNEEL